MKISKILKNGVLSAFLIATVCSPALCLTFSDNFSTLDTFWWTAQTIGAGANVSQTSGEIIMSQSAATTGSASLVFNFALTGDFTAQVDYRLITWPTNNDERLGIGVKDVIAVERISDTGYINDTSSGEGYLTHGLISPGGIYHTATINDRSGKLELVRSGNSLAGYYWDGAAWVLIHTYSGLSLPSTLSDLLLSIWPQDLNANISVAFDNFYLNAPGTTDPTPPGPGPNPIPEPATMLLFGAGLIGLACCGRKKLS